MTDTELIARQAKQIAELRTSAKTITWPVVHHDVLSALLDAAEENVRLRAEVASARAQALADRAFQAENGRLAAERDTLRAEVERLGEPALLAANKVLIAEFDMLKADYDKLRARDQRIRELAAATGEAQRFQLEARFETKLDCLLDAIEETP